MPTKLVNIVMDVADPIALGRFWAGMLAWEFVRQDGYATVRAPASIGLDVDMIPVPDPKPAGLPRVHLDLASGSEDEKAENIARARRLGGRSIDIGQQDVPWEVMADPEGNPFCVWGPSEPYRDTGAIGGILIDSADPAAQAEFWSAATGWKLGRTREGKGGLAALRSPDGHGPWLEFWQAEKPKRGKNRLHLDVVPPPGGDNEAEAERLIALGARRADIGQQDVPWIVLADPEGNEFCVLRRG